MTHHSYRLQSSPHVTVHPRISLIQHRFMTRTTEHNLDVGGRQNVERRQKKPIAGTNTQVFVPSFNVPGHVKQEQYHPLPVAPEYVANPNNSVHKE
jgi:hypothetical protein